jgi:hypothetical protein
MENVQAIFVEAKSKNFVIIINHDALAVQSNDGVTYKAPAMAIIPTKEGRNGELVPDLKRFAARVSSTYRSEKLQKTLEFGSMPRSFNVPNVNIAADVDTKNPSSYVNEAGMTTFSTRFTQSGQDKVALAFLDALEAFVEAPVTTP